MRRGTVGLGAARSPRGSPVNTCPGPLPLQHPLEGSGDSRVWGAVGGGKGHPFCGRFSSVWPLGDSEIVSSCSEHGLCHPDTLPCCAVGRDPVGREVAAPRVWEDPGRETRCGTQLSTAEAAIVPGCTGVTARERLGKPTLYCLGSGRFRLHSGSLDRPSERAMHTRGWGSRSPQEDTCRLLHRTR